MLVLYWWSIYAVVIQLFMCSFHCLLNHLLVFTCRVFTYLLCIIIKYELLNILFRSSFCISTIALLLSALIIAALLFLGLCLMPFRQYWYLLWSIFFLFELLIILICFFAKCRYVFCIIGSSFLIALSVSIINRSAWSVKHCSSWRKYPLSWSDEHCSSWWTLSLIRLHLDNIGSKCNPAASCFFVKELALLWCERQLPEISYSFFFSTLEIRVFFLQSLIS